MDDTGEHHPHPHEHQSYNSVPDNAAAAPFFTLLNHHHHHFSQLCHFHRRISHNTFWIDFAIWFFVYGKIVNIVWCPFNQMGINLGESLTHLFQFQSRHTDIRQRFLQGKKLPLWDSHLIHLRWSELGKSLTRCPITPSLPIPPSLPPCIVIIPILFPLHQELWCQGEGDVSC